MVRHGLADLCAGAPEDEEDVRGDQHHLERDEQVEQVAGQERQVHPGEQHQVDRVERAALLRGRQRADRVHQACERHRRGDDDHRRRQPVGDQRDADRRIPATGLRGGDADVEDRHEDRDADPERRRADGEAERALRPQPPR